MLSMHGNSIKQFYYHFLDYQVVIIKHNHESHMNIMKWHFYGMTAANKHHSYLRLSRRFESI
jgi:hypothetical protein